jgi:hypothetical protein
MTETARASDERNLGMAAGLMQAVRRMPDLTPAQAESLRELARGYLARVDGVAEFAADDAFRIAFAARRNALSQADRTRRSWAQLTARKAVRELGLAFEDSVTPDARRAHACASSSQ